jgi:hypothetical protein
MDINSKYIELFEKGKEFEKILFLDNFYENVSLEIENSETIIKLLSSAINCSLNQYIKRSSFKLLCDLTLIRKITNQFSTFSFIQDFLFNSDVTLQVIALKYLPYFPEVFTDKVKERIKELSDDSNGEIASQSYLCLGLYELNTIFIKTENTDLILNLTKSKSFFIASEQATENRVDAEFYILLTEWVEISITNDTKSIQSKFIEIEKNLKVRRQFEFDEQNLELDFMIFQITDQLKSTFELVSTSKQWLDFKDQTQALLNISIEIEKIRQIDCKNQSYIESLYHGLFKRLEINLYNIHLRSEKQRFEALNSHTRNLQLKSFIEYILTLFLENTEEREDNLELLALLSENLGGETGLKLYSQILSREVTFEKVISNLLRKNNNNQLPFRTGSIYGQEVLFNLMEQIEKVLPNYPKDKFEIFFNIVEEVIRYTRVTLVGNERNRFLFLFDERGKGKGQKATEQDLQDSMYSYFVHSKIADGLELEKAKFVDGGRVDILYKKDIISIPIELKKSLNRPNKMSLEKNYIAQAQTYTAGYDQLGIFVLLELSDKSIESEPNFQDWFKIHHLPPSTNQEIEYPDYIISVVIPGNRTSPSAKSNYI